jgi:hypothetical protein
LAYYVLEDWNYREVLLGFEPVIVSHTGQILAQIIEGVVTQFYLAHCLLAVTCDNASNNSTMCCALKDALRSHNVKWSADVMNVSCLAHVWNLSANALLVGLDVTNEESCIDNLLELDESSPELSPSSATNNVAQTVIKVCCSIVIYYFSKANNTSYGRYTALVFLLPVPRS